MSAVDDPFVGPPPTEVPLANAPLVRVLAQVRFPEVLKIEQREFVSLFQESVRAKYPVLRPEQTQIGVLSSAGLVPAKTQMAWRFSDLDSHWRVSLTPEFLAIETTKYTSRADFIARLREVLTALDEQVGPKLIDRLGVRYIGRITGDSVDEIETLVRPEVRGISGTSIGSRAVHALSETMFELEGARFVARWGRLSPGKTIDPTAIEPINEKSWILDLDMFSAAPVKFAVDQVVEDARRYAERAYAFFRWAVTDEFLRRHGGQV
jgi:uncharacterized protein (TIGR04255 family)